MFISILIVAALLGVSELWWRSSKVHNEISRKFVHITVGSFVAFWPFFLSWQQIRLLSVLFLVGVGLSKYLHLLNAIHSVQRPTWGEIFFAVAVGVVTLVTQDKWIYMAALLQMSLADGLAAIIGVRFGHSTSYRIFGHAKSLIGSLACFALSVAILWFYRWQSGSSLSGSAIIGMSVGVSALENIGLFGLDNLVIPVVVALILAKL